MIQVLLLLREVPTVLIHNLLYVRMSSTPAKAASQQNHFSSFVKFCQILILQRSEISLSPVCYCLSLPVRVVGCLGNAVLLGGGGSYPLGMNSDLFAN